MLRQLTIRNIAIVEQLEVGFQPGLTVITGESGSGKSILVDAIALAFGARVSPREILRAGCERGQVELLFEAESLLQKDARFRQMLLDQGVEPADGETEILISREFTATGSRSRINGVPVTREVLETLRPWVVDLHGQHELTSLFLPERQRAYLDALGDLDFQALKGQVAQAYTHWQTLFHRREQLARDRQAFLQRKDFLDYQFQELTEAGLSDDQEDTRLQQEREVLSHADKLLRVAAQASGILSEGDGQLPPVLDQLSQVTRTVSEGAPYDARLEEMLSQLEGAQTELRAVAAELGRYADRVDVSPERLDEITARLDQLEKLKRKYGPALSDVLAAFERVQAERNALEADEADQEGLERQLAEAETALKELSAVLGRQRRVLADQLTSRLLAELNVLALPSVQFEVAFEPIPYSGEGMDAVTFLFSANPGEPLRPLAKVASGGELSRFLLAMKVLLARADGIQTLVFDEIDSGVSGPTARAVAEKLAGLSASLQVLVITHQPMIAAMGREHWHVEKQLRGAGTTESVYVHAERLDDETRRLRVLSRLASGTDTSDETVERFIRRLLEEARTIHQTLTEPRKNRAQAR